MIGDYAVATLAAPYYAAALPQQRQNPPAPDCIPRWSNATAWRGKPRKPWARSAPLLHYGYQPFAAKGAGGLDGGGQQHAYTVGGNPLRAETRLGLALGYQQRHAGQRRQQ